MFLISYRAKDALHIETQFIGPFDTFDEAYDFLATLPPAIECEHKFVQEMVVPIWEGVHA